VPLTFESQVGDSAIYTAKVRPMTVNFHYTARLGDGRTRKPSQVKYVHRPHIEQQEGYLLLPDYVGLRPNGKPYEERQPTGDIKGMPGLQARIVVKVQKPIYRAVLQTFGTPFPDVSGPDGLTKTQQDNVTRLTAVSLVGLCALPEAGPMGAFGWTGQLGPTPHQRRYEWLTLAPAQPTATGPDVSLGVLAPFLANQVTIPLRKFEQSFEAGTQQVEWQFDLKPTETSYSVVVFDKYGFASKSETVRALKIEPEPPPTIDLYPEWNMVGTTDFADLPLPILPSGKPGKQPISYKAFGPYGVGKVRLMVEVIRPEKSSDEPQRRKWERKGDLELKEYSGFPPWLIDLDTGTFREPTKKKGDREQVFFCIVPLPSGQWPRMHAAGSFDYHLAGFVDVTTGNPVQFQVGDRVTFYLEVYNRNPDPTKVLKAVSQKREKRLETLDEFARILRDVGQEMTRIEALMYLQQQVYDQPK
jgi:hypothetical protein